MGRKRMARKQSGSSHKKLSGKMATEESSLCLIDEKKEKSETKSASLKDHIISLIVWLKMFLKGESPLGALCKNYFLSFIYRLPFLNVFLLKKESPSSHIDRSLSLLDEQELEYRKVIRWTPLKDHILSLKLALTILETFLIMSSNEDLKMRIEHVLYEVRWELHSFSYRLTTNGSLILHMNRVYTNLREKMKDVIIEQETSERDAIFPKLTSTRDLRKINDFLFQSIWELTCFIDSLFPPLMEKIEEIKVILKLLQDLLTKDEYRKLLTPVVELHEKIACLLYSSLVGGMDEQMELVMKHKELEDLWMSVMLLAKNGGYRIGQKTIQKAKAYKAGYIIDTHLVDTLYSHSMLNISEIMEKTEKFKVTRIDVTENCYIQAQDVPTTFHCVPQATSTPNDEVVGFEDEADYIMEYLLADTKQRAVISIVGMAGLGKTTLARKVYDVPRIRKHFDVRAWCSVSQTYRKRELLLNILGDVVTITEEIKKLNDEELAAKLYQSLKGRRYFIVIDDMWDIEAWDNLVRSLPDDRIHSRIIITSRLQNVVPQRIAFSKVYRLREFSEKKSWDLFRKKLFEKESFSQQFLEVGKEIVQSCKGLPLAIVVVAGLLAKVGENIFEWKRIALNLNSHILSYSGNHCKAVLELSYDHMPDHLKSCFLYFGAFKEDAEIPVWKLKWLWIAEGFVRNREAMSLEDVAEEYLMNLISRSLVSATKERSRGGVKACHIHDLLRDFCLQKCKEENFLQVIHASNSSDFSIGYDQRRLSIYSEVCHLMEATPYGFNVQSLLHTAVWEDSYLWDASFIFHNFNLLQVLDLAFLNLRESFSGIQSLIHLKYLSIRAETDSIPSSISNLQNLQFLLIKLSRYYKYGGKVVKVPDSLWDMVNLKHVHIINRSASFHVEARRLQKSSLLDNLETLSTPCLSYGEEAENLLRRLLKLRKLRCVFMYCLDDSTNCYRFPVLDFLHQLMCLKVYFDGPASWGKKCEFNFPSNLQKLSFSNFRLSWSDISKIGKTLPNLKVLKLTGVDRENIWDMNEGDFPKLKYLKLSRLIHLQEWIASEDALPTLEQLVLENCWELDEIPPCFGEHNTLRVITVRDCKPSVDDSARTIQEEQYEELQNEDFKVYIYPRKPKSSTF